jgi:hypothetical protein
MSLEFHWFPVGIIIEVRSWLPKTNKSPRLNRMKTMVDALDTLAFMQTCVKQ